MDKRYNEQKFYTVDSKSIYLQPTPKVFYQFELSDITEILIGSNADFLKINELTSSLKKNGYDVDNIKIIPSNIPSKKRVI